MTEGGARPNNRLLIADRSDEFRQAAALALNAGGEWLCQTVSTAEEARERIARWDPAVVILEHELPGNENGEFAQRLLQAQRPVPVIAIRRGRTGGLAGPYAAVIGREPDAGRVAMELAHLLAARGLAEEPARKVSRRFVAIGASTGGTEAVERVLLDMAPNGPGIVIAQHIPPKFSATFAERLNRVTPLAVREARDGDAIRDGEALVAPGDWHMCVRQNGAGWEVRLDQGEKIWHQRPAVDRLFSSVAEQAAGRAVGVLLTGMGRDGATGLGMMRKAGCWTIAQDEATCVVFGMPRVAIEAGAACEVVALPQVAAAIQARSAGSYFPKK